MSAVENACEQEWPGFKSDCSGFFRAVASAVGVPVAEGTADEVLSYLAATPSGFRLLSSGVDAATAASQGELVVGGLKGAEQQTPSVHGHLVVVTGPPLAQGKYPTAYWGTLGGVGSKATTTNYAWRAVDRDNVRYYARPLP